MSVSKQEVGGDRSLPGLCVQEWGKGRAQHADREHSFQLKASPISRHSPQEKPGEREATVWKSYFLAPSSPTQLESKRGTFQGFQAALLSPRPGAMSTISLEVCQVHTRVRVTGTNRPGDRQGRVP